VFVDDAWPNQPPGRRRRSAQWRRLARARLLAMRDRLPPETAAELRAAAMRLRQARSPRDAVGALDHEIEHFFHGVAPGLIERPLPITTLRRAYTSVTVVAGTSAAIEEIEAISLLIPGVDLTAVPTLPLVVISSFTALALEAYIAASYRVHRLRAAGREVDPAKVMSETLQAMTGRAEVKFTRSAAQALSRRTMRRWSRGVVPIVGMGYSSWDARKTITEIARMPV
jgi:hypothetical protein